MQKKYLASLFVLFTVISTTVCSQAQPKVVSESKGGSSTEGVKVTYIANEGVFLEAGNKKVLIDGLHREYRPAYAFPPDDLRKNMENAKAPYDEIDLLLVSHLHLDHFHPESIGLHLKNNPKSTLITSNQVIDEVKNGFTEYDAVKKQIRPITHRQNQVDKFDFDGIRLKVLGIEHINRQFKSVQNLGYVVEMGGKKFLHIGDASVTEENFKAFNLHEENIDVAFLPLWFLISPTARDLVKKHFNPKHIVAVHISPSLAQRAKTELVKHYSDITIFTSILETKTF